MEVEKLSSRPKFCADCQSKFSFTRTHKSIPLNITLKVVLRSKVLSFEIFCQFTSVYPNIPGSNLEEKGEKRKGGKEEKERRGEEEKEDKTCWKREFISTHTASKAEGPLRARSRRGRIRSGPEVAASGWKNWGGLSKGEGKIFSSRGGENFLVHFLWGTMLDHTLVFP